MIQDFLPDLPPMAEFVKTGENWTTERAVFFIEDHDQNAIFDDVLE